MVTDKVISSLLKYFPITDNLRIVRLSLRLKINMGTKFNASSRKGNLLKKNWI